MSDSRTPPSPGDADANAAHNQSLALNPEGASDTDRPEPDDSDVLSPATQAGRANPLAQRRFSASGAPLEVVSWVENSSRRGPLRVLRDSLFWVAVVIPTLTASLYLGLVASDVYISESRFVVRAPQRAAQPGLLGTLLQGSGFNRSQDDALTVHDFIRSRDALAELDAAHGVRNAYSSMSIDVFNRFPGLLDEANFENLFKHYLKHLNVEYDANSSITTLRVSGYSASQAKELNTSLLAMSERLINTINERGRQDLIRFAIAEVSEAEGKAKAAALAVASYRNQRAVFDPERQSALQLQQINKLQDELIATKIQLAQIQALSPQNPQIPTLQRRAKGLQDEMSNEMAKVAGNGGSSGTNTLSNKAADFERLTLERAFADRQVASALTSLENARNEARRKQLYLERVVQPNLPDYAVEPKRLRGVLTILALGLAIYGIGVILRAGVREHEG